MNTHHYSVVPPEPTLYKPDHPGHSWYRVIEADGSTVAFVPDQETANDIAEDLERRHNPSALV